MMARVKDLSKKDDKTFVIALREPYGLIFETMAKTATPILYIMRKKEAETDPNQQITEYIGSGPFTYNRNETQRVSATSTTASLATCRVPSLPPAWPARSR